MENDMKFEANQLLYCFGVILVLAIGGVGYYAIFTDTIEWMVVSEQCLTKRQSYLCYSF
jgi:hypothetical protein